MVDVRQSLVSAVDQATSAGVPEATIRKILESELPSLPKYKKARCSISGLVYVTIFYLLPLLSVVGLLGYGVWNYYQEYPCYYFVPAPLQEILGPLADCEFCKGIDHVPKLSNLSTVEFVQHYGFSGRPIVVTDATKSWKASSVFSYDFFKQLYMSNPDSLENDKTHGQFFQYNSNIRNLNELFSMSEDSARFKTEKWYIGWSTGDVDIRNELGKYFTDPYFLPQPMDELPDAEPRFLAWIFMGAPGPGASLHIDHVGSPSWQAQLVGTKTWTLAPPPECTSVCSSFNVTINTGEMIVIDTNQWFHSTYIHPGNISITIGSEYD